MTLLAVEGLSKRFGGVRAVESLSFQVEAGTLFGIIGPNGAGKTSLFNLMSGFLKADRGSVSLAGAELVGRPAHAVARAGLARTFQLVRPFVGLRTLEVLMLPLGAPGRGLHARECRRRALAQLEALGLGAHAQAPAESLNQGELRLLDIGRALAQEPAVLLLDEPFSGLGLPAIRQLIRCLQDRRANGGTTVIIEHRLRELMPLMDRVLVMNFGERLAEGTPAQIAHDERVIEAYLGRPGGAA